MRIPMIAAAGGLVLAIGGMGLYMSLSSPSSHLSPAMINSDGADIGGPFELTSHTGERLTDEAVIKGPTLVYFGYTYCPDVCPIDVQILADAVTILDDEGVDVLPVFITVDPERDTPEELAYYAEAMHPKMLALTGTSDEIRAAADAYKVFYQRVDMPDSAAGYLMNHTGYTYLMTPEKGITAVFRRDFPPEQIADDVQKVLARL